MLQRPPGDAFTVRIHTPANFLGGESVRVPDAPAATRFVREHDAAPVQAEQFGHQMQHLAQRRRGGQAFADKRHHLLQ